MIAHALKYVQMAELVMHELDALVGPRTRAYAELDVARAELIEAEQYLVEAYGTWRDAMKLAEEAGSRKAPEYLRRTTWDLT